jgi:hypothetical protein
VAGTFISLLSAVPGAVRALISIQNWAEKFARKPLQAEVTRINASGFLSGYDVRVTNRGEDLIHLVDMVITRPENATFAFRWPTPITIVDDARPIRDDSWETGHRFQIDYDLSPADDARFQIAIPSGFAIYPSRRAPVVIVLRYLTGGWRQRNGSVALVRTIVQTQR